MSNKQPEPAATLMLLRDTASGIEVFMVQRPSRGAFPGLHVFTGGKVDATDAQLLTELPWVGQSEEAAQLSLDTPRAMQYYMAAVRECYEESGVLLGSVNSQLIGKGLSDRLQRERQREFGALCTELDVCLELGELHYFSHWITPAAAPRRFDTRFFVARMPAGQVAIHAEGETVGGEWIVPADALERGQQGAWMLIMPTMVTLQSLSKYQTIDALFDAMKNRQHQPTYSAELAREGMQADKGRTL